MFGTPDRFLNMNKDKSNYLEDDELEIRKIMESKKKEAEKVFIQMVINDYICKGKTWEDLQKDFRPSGAMSIWTRDTAELLGLKTTTNYNLMSPLMSPLKGYMKKRRKKSKAKQRSKSKPKKSKPKKYKSRLTKRK